MTTSKRRPDAGDRPPSRPSAGKRGAATSPLGTTRVGRRETARRRHQPERFIERFRTPILAIAVIVVVVGVSAFVFASAAQPTYACTSVDTVKPAASGDLGQVQADMGNQHVNPGERITYPVCPPASGRHVNRQGFGPLVPKVYGPEDQSAPTGWVHNLEHGGLVLLYSCDKGACDDATIAQLQAFSSGFPTSAVCGLSPGIVGPVVARFEQMPTKFAALVWDRVLYLDTLDTSKVYEFFTRYAERVTDDGAWLAPPEPQCSAPSPSAGPSASPGASGSPAPSASPVASGSPSAVPSAAPSSEPSPAAS